MLKLLVFVNAFNFKDTIQKCLDSILNQKTSFDYKIIIRDDASTDGTTNILNNYQLMFPDKIILKINRENQFSKGNFAKDIKDTFKSMIEAEYIAFCDGDDYWTDEFKLQKQIEKMQENDSIVGCCGQVSLYSFKQGFIQIKPDILDPQDQYLDQEALLKNYVVYTSTVVYRFGKFRNEFIKNFPNKGINIDQYCIYFYSQKGVFYYFNSTFACRTIDGYGIWMGNDLNDDNRLFKYFEELISIRQHFDIVFKDNPIIKNMDCAENVMYRIVRRAIQLNNYEVISNIINKFPELFFKIFRNGIVLINTQRKLDIELKNHDKYR